MNTLRGGLSVRHASNNCLGFAEDEQPSYEEAISRIMEEDRARVEEAMNSSFNVTTTLNQVFDEHESRA